MTVRRGSSNVAPGTLLPPLPARQPDRDPAEVHWQAIKAEVVLRDGRRCKRCSARKRLTVHHITPREQGGTDDSRNLITLCTDCHDRIEVAQAEGAPWLDTAKSLASKLPDPPTLPSDMRAAFVTEMAQAYKLAGAHWGSNGESGGVWGVDRRGLITFISQPTRQVAV